MQSLRTLLRSRTADACPPDDAQKFGNMVLSASFYAIVVVVVVAALATHEGPWNHGAVVGLLVACAIYAAFPIILERAGAWAVQPTEIIREGVAEPIQADAVYATARGRWIYFVGFVPAGLAFSYFAMLAGRASFFPILPLFVLAGFSSTLFSYLGSTVCSIALLGGLQALMGLALDYWMRWSDLFGIGVGLIVFNIIFLISNSAVRSRRESEGLARALTASNAKLRDYALRVEDLAVAEERNRLAREIHDSIGHALTVVNVQVEAARTVLESNPAKAREALAAAQAYTRQGLQEVRTAVSSLRASPLEGKSLLEWLEELLERARQAGLTATLEVRGEARSLSANLELTLRRAAQEAVTNTLRHAAAGKLEMALDLSAEERISLEIRDDGRGADPEALNGFGLLGLRERIGHHGGETRIETAPGKGFFLGLSLPVQ